MEKLTLTLGKSTKNKHVYEDKSDLAPIPSVYITRDSLPKPPPQSIIITIELK